MPGSGVGSVGCQRVGDASQGLESKSILIHLLTASELTPQTTSTETQEEMTDSIVSRGCGGRELHPLPSNLLKLI